MAIPVPNPKIRLSIVHEDARVIVCDKAPGVVSEPGRSHPKDSLLNGLFARYAKQLAPLGEVRDYGVLHRLDRMTSGCLCCALDRDAYDFLRKEWELHRVRKSYLTIALGCTGGRHRSVAIAEDLAKRLRRRGYDPRVQHRDLDR